MLSLTATDINKLQTVFDVLDTIFCNRRLNSDFLVHGVIDSVSLAVDLRNRLARIVSKQHDLRVVCSTLHYATRSANLVYSSGAVIMVWHRWVHLWRGTKNSNE